MATATQSPTGRAVNLGFALGFHVLLALIASLWGATPLSAVSWFAIAAVMVVWRNARPGLIWLLPFAWAITSSSLVASGVLVLALLALVVLEQRGPTEAPEEEREAVVAPPPPLPAAGDTAARIAAIEAQIAGLEDELRELRLRQRREEAQRSEETARLREEATARRQAAAAPSVVERRPPRDLSELFGARTFAWLGGLVTLLGIVFFFVVAVNRGWVTPGMRVVLGAATSTALFVAAVALRRRYGQLQAGLAAAGAAVAGWYTTVWAATALYDFLSTPVALLAVAAIAAVGAGTALAWKTQVVAGLGLIPAMFVPLVIDGDVTRLDAGFVAVVLAATVALTVRERWLESMLAGALASFVQVGLLLGEANAGRDARTAAVAAVFWGLYLAAAVGHDVRPGRTPWFAFNRPIGVVALLVLTVVLAAAVVIELEPGSPAAVAAIAAAFWLVYLAVGVAYQLRLGGALRALTGTAVAASVGVAFGAVFQRFEGETFDLSTEGLALVGAALVYLVPLPFLRGRGQRDLATILWAAALSVAAVAAAELVGGAALALAWSAQAALLAFVGARVREPRFFAASLAYLALAGAQALAFEAPPEHLLATNSAPARGLASVAFVAAAALAFGLFAPWARARLAAFAVAGALALYGASLALLALFVELSGVSLAAAFDRGHAALSAFWAASALALLTLALARRLPALYWGALALFALALAKLASYDALELARLPRSWGYLACALLFALAAFAHGRFGERVRAFDLPPARLHLASVALVGASLAFGLAALFPLLEGTVAGIDREGAGILAASLFFALLAALAFPRAGERDLSTLLWAPALALAALAFGLLLEGEWLVLAWAAGAAALAAAPRLLGEPRFFAASLAYLALAGAQALAFEAPPEHLFATNSAPARGLASVAFVAAAALAFGLFAPWARARLAAFAVAGALALYGASLALLALFVELSGVSLAAAFDRGHTAVTALWALVALTLLSVGLVRASRSLRLAGLALFAAALAKIFTYDLAGLSSLARALSFLAVGALLLVAAFFYERLSERLAAERGDA